MNPRQLEIFRAIMRDGSVTAAANSLSISQPAASKMLHHLESQLGYRLFERLSGRLVPTAEARLLYDDVDRVFRQIEVLKNLAASIGERKIGLLRIGASPPVAYSILPTALQAFKRRHPTVKIHLHTLPKRESAEQLLTGDIDLAVTLSTIQAPTVRSAILANVRMVAVMREGDPLAELDEITPFNLAGRPLISYGPGAEISAALDSAFERHRCTRELSIQIASSVGCGPLVHAGLGVALVDGLGAWHKFGGLVSRPFSPAVSMQVAASTNSARPASRYARDFVGCLREALSA